MKMKEKMWHQRKSVGPVQPLGLPDLHGERLSIPRQQAAVAPEKREPCGRLCAIQNPPKSFCQQQLEPILQTISGNNSGEKKGKIKKYAPSSPTVHKFCTRERQIFSDQLLLAAAKKPRMEVGFSCLKT